MRADDAIELTSEGAVPLSPSSIPVEKLITEVYEASPENVKKDMLNLLVVGAYEASPPLLRKSLLEQLIRSVGVLGLVTVAGGVFAEIRLRESWPNGLVNSRDLQIIRKADVLALVDYVQQVSSSAIADVVQMLVNNPALTGSGAVAVLASILLRSVPERRRTSRECI
jgi:hypothetical protein